MCVCVCVCVCAILILIVEQYSIVLVIFIIDNRVNLVIHFIFNSELDMSVLSTLFEFSRLTSIPLSQLYQF